MKALHRSLLLLLVPLLLLLSITASPARAQTPEPTQPLAHLKEYLQLSDQQLQTLFASNDELNRWIVERMQRVSQVQTELSEEVTRDILQPMALGLRYAELESICREMKSRAASNQQKNADALTPPQKVKLAALQEAIRLAPLISQAQSANLLGPVPFFPQLFANTSGEGGGFGIGLLSAPWPGTCYFAPSAQFPSTRSGSASGSVNSSSGIPPYTGRPPDMPGRTSSPSLPTRR